MSKFAEKLQRVYHGSAPAMGFRKSVEAEVPPLLIVASLAKTNAAEAGALAATGIDAAILGLKGLTAKNFAQLAEAVGYIPLGLSLETAEKDVIAKALELGCDFVVFGLKTPMEAVKREGLGRILKVEPSLEPGLVRAINGLPISIDAVLVSGDELIITVERLLVYQRFADLLDKPLLVTLSSAITDSELGGLFETGVNGLIMPEALTPEVFANIKKASGGLSRATRRKTKAAAILPRLGGEVDTGVEEEDDEDI